MCTALGFVTTFTTQSMRTWEDSPTLCKEQNSDESALLIRRKPIVITACRHIILICKGLVQNQINAINTSNKCKIVL